MRGQLLATLLMLTGPSLAPSEVLSGKRLDLQTELLGRLAVTSYRSVRSQTDSSPMYTSIGVHTNPYIAAVSQDLLKSGQVHYGDILYIDGFGFKHVADCMNKRHTHSVDIWVETRAQEKKIGIRQADVWIIRKGR